MTKKVLQALCCLAITLAFYGCSDSGSHPIPTTVVLSSTAVGIDNGQQTTLTATVTGDPSNKGVTWSLSCPGGGACGTLANETTTSVTYIAPSLTAPSKSGPKVTASNLQAVVTATAIADTTKFSSSTITVAPPPFLGAPTLQNADTGGAYTPSAQATVTGGTSPYTWSLASGSLPTGITLNTSTGAISAATVATTAHTSSFTLKVTDSSAATPLSDTSGTLTITVNTKITTSSLPQGEVNLAYGPVTLAAVGGSGTYTWAQTGLPTGMNLNASTGVIDGAPTVTCSPCTVNVTVDDGTGNSDTKALSLTIAPPPTISTTSLPDATVNVAYTPQTLTASGGVAPYKNWMVSFGSLPTGLSLSSGGVISGTPGCPSGLATFGVTVQDNLNVTSAEQSLNINVSTQPLAITTTTIPNATAGTAYTQQIATSGGACSGNSLAPITWSADSPLPSWLNLSSSGVLNGTPTSGDVGGPINLYLRAYDGTTYATQTLSITVVNNGVNNAELNGTYAFVLGGFDPSGDPMSIGGSFTANGSGGITGGVFDMNSATQTLISDATVSSTGSSYWVGADQRGQLTLMVNGTPWTFDFSVGSISGTTGVASLGHIISRQTNGSAGSAMSGDMEKQDTNAFSLTNLAGNWAFGIAGMDAYQNRDANAGKMTLSSAGAISNGMLDETNQGWCDTNGNNCSRNVTFTSGSLGSIDGSYGRVPMTITVSGGGDSHSVVYIVSASKAFVMNTDGANGPVSTGTTLKRTLGTFNNNSMNGYGIVSQQSAACCSGNATYVMLGRLSANGSGGFTIGIDENDAGTITSNQSQSGTYSVDPSSGRMTIAGVGNHPPVFYLVGLNQAFLVDTGGGAGSGFVEPQANGPFSISSGGRSSGTEAPPVNTAGVQSGVSTVTQGSPATTGTVSNKFNDTNSIGGGLQENQTGSSESVTVDAATGRLTYGGSKVGYVINSTKRVQININPSNNNALITVTDNQ